MKELVVLKVGGSLCISKSTLKKLCKTIEDASKNAKIVIVPGGGALADEVRRIDAELKLPSEVSHEMALYACDQNGLAIASMLRGFGIARRLAECRGKTVLLPRDTVMKSGLPASWDLTSDSIAAYVSGRLKAKRLVKLTDVDGLYARDPKKASNASMIRNTTATKVGRMKEKCVDKHFPGILRRYNITCHIINGRRPERLTELMTEGSTECTTITPE
ncbi:MAG: hypothetical protein NTU61_02180 [Candidatus Altiarchaeota archaeon]|nr:hypothetical protein [Candidatus Altiarchaeota archaeon]